MDAAGPEGAGADDEAYLRWDEFLSAGEGLFLWEAFVTAGAKARDLSHHGDAATAVHKFCDLLPDPTVSDEVSADHPSSLIAAAALWSGWPGVADNLRHRCLVV